MSGNSKSVFAFGPFRLDPAERSLVRDGAPVALTSKAFELLLHLVENGGRLIRKEDLLTAVWPGTFVEEAVLSVNISAIRKALGDDRNGHTYIATVIAHGYRFVAPVQRIDVPEGGSRPSSDVADADVPVADAPSAGATLPSARKRMIWIAAGAALVVFGVVALGVARHRMQRGATGSSIAVLPLRSLSSGAEPEEFAGIMTDLLITDLGQIPALRVVSSQSVMQYKESRRPMPEIARELNVEYIAEGTVARDGDRVRITAQLIHGASDRHLWAKSYERELRGTFAMQNDVAESIAREMGVALAGSPPVRRPDEYVSTEAYEAYLRGNYLADSGNSTGALEQFRNAIKLYPAFSAAYESMASVYFGLAYFGQQAPKDAYPNMKEAALKAIDIDANNAGAHAALAEVKLHYDRDWKGADLEFRRSLELNPSSSFVRHLYAHYKLTVGLPAESLEEMDRAFEIDPVGVFTAI